LGGIWKKKYHPYDRDRILSALKAADSANPYFQLGVAPEAWQLDIDKAYNALKNKYSGDIGNE